MLRSIILIELRVTEPAEDTHHPLVTHTAVLLYGEDSSLCYTFTTELQPILRYRTTVLTTSKYCCNALQSSAVPPSLPLLRFTTLPHVCLLHWLRGMRFRERHPGLLQIEGGIAITARLRRALQRNNLRRKFYLGRGGTAPAPRRIIVVAVALPGAGLSRS